jgi:hypothetical protein
VIPDGTLCQSQLFSRAAFKSSANSKKGMGSGLPGHFDRLLWAEAPENAEAIDILLGADFMETGLSAMFWKV